jgi:hypothetical protein
MYTVLAKMFAPGAKKLILMTFLIISRVTDNEPEGIENATHNTFPFNFYLFFCWTLSEFENFLLILINIATCQNETSS